VQTHALGGMLHLFVVEKYSTITPQPGANLSHHKTSGSSLFQTRRITKENGLATEDAKLPGSGPMAVTYHPSRVISDLDQDDPSMSLAKQS